MHTQGPEDKHQLLLLTLLCLLGWATEGIAAVLVGQCLDKGGMWSGPAWPTSPTRISWPSSLTQEEEHHLPVLLYLLWLPQLALLHATQYLGSANRDRHARGHASGSGREMARRAREDTESCFTAAGVPLRPLVLSSHHSLPHLERSTVSTTVYCSFHF